MSRENVADYTQIPTFDTQEGKEGPSDDTANQAAPTSRRYRRFYLTCRDCVIVSLVVGIALVAIIVSLVFGLPALEEKRREMLNGTLSDSIAETATEILDKASEAAGIS